MPSDVRGSFPAEPSAAAAARRLVRRALTAWGAAEAEAVAEAELLTCELVTNAIVHAGSAVEIVCAYDPRHVSVNGDSGPRPSTAGLRVEVTDRRPDLAVGYAGGGSRRRAGSDLTGGRGLMLTASMAEEWGVTYRTASKTVWFRIGMPPVETSAAELTPETLAEEVLRAGRTLPELRRRAADAVRDVTGAEAAYVLVADETLAASESWRLAAATGDAQADDVQTGDGQAGDGQTGDGQASDGQAGDAAVRLGDAQRACGRLTVHNGLRAPWSTLPPLRDGAARSLITAPLSADGRLSGVLIASDTRSGRFGPAAADRLGRLARRLAEPLERVRLAERERVQRGWLSFLAEASDLLAGTLDARLITALAGQLVVARLGTWCATYVHDPAGPSTLADARHRDERRIPALRATLEAAGPPRRAPRPAAWESVPDSWVHAFPLVAGGRTVGTLVIGREDAPFTAELLKLAEDLSRRVAVALDAARLYQLQAETSRVLQRSLLPSRSCEVPGLDFGVVYEPAGEGLEVGGDFYDVFRAGPGRWLFAIGDVCGTGPEAAAVTGLARHALRLLAREGHGLPRILHRLNEAILDKGPQARFLSMICGEILAGGPGTRRMSVVCAGHPPPLLLTPEGKVTPVASSQLLLGIDPEVAYTAESLHLEPGDSLVCVTDGVTERRAQGRELDDDDGLARLLADCGGLSAEGLAQRVRAATHRFATTPPQDDLAILTLQATSAHPPHRHLHSL